MYKIMIVEDDKALCTHISEMLIKWGFDALVVDNFENINAEFVINNPNLIIMDVNLPCFDGFYWCNKIREISKVPLIFVSSRDTNMDIIMAMNTGGDDYITKPFSMDILIAKINSLLRRTYSYGEQTSDLVECDGVILNLMENILMFKDKNIELTKNEFKVMLLLMKSKGKTISRERIMRAIWDDDNFINDNTLTVNINRLRTKLGDLGLKNYIITKKGYGYMIL